MEGAKKLRNSCESLCAGRGDLQSQLDSAVSDLRQKANAAQDVERNAVRAAMLEERARYCLFIGAIKPLIVRATRGSLLGPFHGAIAVPSVTRCRRRRRRCGHRCAGGARHYR